MPAFLMLLFHSSETSFAKTHQERVLLPDEDEIISGGSCPPESAHHTEGRQNHRQGRDGEREPGRGNVGSGQSRSLLCFGLRLRDGWTRRE
jgi:hypothetical protein